MNTLTMSGTVSARLIHAKKAPLSWKLRNVARWAYVWGWLTVMLAKALSRLTGIVTITTELRAMHKHNGLWTDYGVLGRRVVTTAGVNFLVDAWQNSVELETMTFHAVGTGAIAEAVGDTGPGTECTVAGIIAAATCTGGVYRPTGVLAEGATANIVRSSATTGFDGSGNITEHVLLSSATVGAGVAWDRTVFAAIPVQDTDTIAWKYEATFSAGG